MKILHPTDLYPYQETAVKHILNKPNAMLWLGVGLGKTHLMHSIGNHVRRKFPNFSIVLPYLLDTFPLPPDSAAPPHIRD